VKNPFGSNTAKLAAIFGIISNLILVAMKITAAFILQNNDFGFSALFCRSLWSPMPSTTCGYGHPRLSPSSASKSPQNPPIRNILSATNGFEYIAGLVVSTIVLVLAVELFRDSLSKIIAQELVDYDLLTAVIILGVARSPLNFFSYVNFGMGKAISSEALKATALDSLTDAIATSPS
jgi:hypothetical protein